MPTTTQSMADDGSEHADLKGPVKPFDPTSELSRYHLLLAESNQQATAREKMRRVAHGIRNPLATIHALCSALLIENTSPEHGKRLELINQQLKRINSVLSDAVGASDGEELAGKQTIDAGEVTISVVDLMQGLIGDRIELRTAIGPSLSCRLNRHQLSIMLYRLVNNAAKALDGRQRPQILLSCVRQGALLEFQVIDNGPGFPREILDKGLRAYACSTADYALGLAVVDRFARSVCGSLHIGNPPGGGARVRLTLPVDPAEFQ